MARPAPVCRRRNSRGRARARERARAAMNDHDDVDGGVEGHRNETQDKELEPDRPDGGIDELRQEGEEEGGGLGIERLDHDAVAKGAAPADGAGCRDGNRHAPRAPS